MFHNFVRSLLVVLFLVRSHGIIAKYQSVHDPLIDVAILFDQSYTMLNFTDNPIWDEMKNWVADYYTRDLGPDDPQFAVMGCGKDSVDGIVYPILRLDGELYNNSLINETDYVKTIWRAIDWERNAVSGFIADNVAGCALSARKNIFKEEYGDRPNATNLVLYVTDCLLWENTGPQSTAIHQLISESSAVLLFICTTDPFDKSSRSSPYLNHMLEWVLGNNDSIFAFSNRESLNERLNNKVLPKINISVTDCNETIVKSGCAPQENGTCARNVTSYILEPPYPKQYGKECTKNGSKPCYPEKCDCNQIPWEENDGPCLNGKKIVRKNATWCNDTKEIDCTIWASLELTSTAAIKTPMTGTMKESTDTEKEPIGSTIGSRETTAELQDNTTKLSGTAKGSSLSAKKLSDTTKESKSIYESTKKSPGISTKPPETETPSSESVMGTTKSGLPEKNVTESSEKTLIIVGVVASLLLLIVLIVIVFALFCRKSKKSQGTPGDNEGAEAKHMVKEPSTMKSMDSKMITKGAESRSDVKSRELRAELSHASSESSFSVPVPGNKSAKEGKSSKSQASKSAVKEAKSSKSQASKSAKEGKSSKMQVKKSVRSPSSGGKSSISHQSNKSAAVSPAGSVKERKSTKSSREKSSVSQGKKSAGGPKSAVKGGKSSVANQGKQSVAGQPSSSSKGAKPSVSQGKKSTVGPSSSVKSGKSAKSQGNKAQVSGKSVKSQKVSKSSKK